MRVESEFGAPRLACASIADAGRGGRGAVFLARRLVQNPTCQNPKRFAPRTESNAVNQFASPISYLVVFEEMYIKLFAHARRKIRNTKSPVTTSPTCPLFGPGVSASGSGASLRATRASTGDGMSLATSESHDPSPEEVRAARAKADAKRGAPRIPVPSARCVLARAFSPPTTDPPVSTQPTPSPHVSTPRSLLHRAHRDRGTPGTRWMRASAVSRPPRVPRPRKVQGRDLHPFQGRRRRLIVGTREGPRVRGVRLHVPGGALPQVFGSDTPPRGRRGPRARRGQAALRRESGRTSPGCVGVEKLGGLHELATELGALYDAELAPVLGANPPRVELHRGDFLHGVEWRGADVARVGQQRHLFRRAVRRDGGEGGGSFVEGRSSSP